MTSFKSMLGPPGGRWSGRSRGRSRDCLPVGVIPPTIKCLHRQRVPGGLVANEARAANVRCAGSTSLAFGGNDAALVMRGRIGRFDSLAETGHLHGWDAVRHQDGTAQLIQAFSHNWSSRFSSRARHVSALARTSRRSRFASAAAPTPRRPGLVGGVHATPRRKSTDRMRLCVAGQPPPHPTSAPSSASGGAGRRIAASADRSPSGVGELAAEEVSSAGMAQRTRLS